MYIDSNIFICAYLNQDKAGAKAREFIKKIIAGEQHSVTSCLALDEVAYVVSEKKGSDFAARVWSNILSIQNLKLLPIDEKVARRVPQFLKSGLMPRDALHAAAMQEHGISVILSFDKDFDSIKSITRKEL
ncbi:type II toxin-antitoxin system VapC family toxin [Candidatus Micrarchaeota archaeon]|nr:type II toxin-antitoxin system VapC family toxin [Candidatus Micrarchaeota archaeon]